MSSPQATVNIPKDVIEPIVREQISKSVIEALGSAEQLVKMIVEKAINQKVNSKGEIDSSEYYNKYSLIDVVSKNAIHDVVKQSILEWVQEKRAEIKAQVVKAIERHKSKFAQALVDGLANQAAHEWLYNIELKIGKDV